MQANRKQYGLNVAELNGSLPPHSAQWVISFFTKQNLFNLPAGELTALSSGARLNTKV